MESFAGAFLGGVLSVIGITLLSAKVPEVRSFIGLDEIVKKEQIESKSVIATTLDNEEALLAVNYLVSLTSQSSGIKDNFRPMKDGESLMAYSREFCNAYKDSIGFNCEIVYK